MAHLDPDPHRQARHDQPRCPPTASAGGWGGASHPRAGLIWGAGHPRAIFAAVMLCSTVALAGDYPLGSMTCDDIGQYAKEIVAGIDAKKTKQAALQELDARKFNDPVEKKNLLDVLNIMYDGFGQSLYPDTAYTAMKYDCEKGRPRVKEQ